VTTEAAMVQIYKTPILALETDHFSAGGGLVRVVKCEDYDRLATLARELATYIAAHGDKHHLPIQMYVLAKDILQDLGEVPHEP
jgi:hypothetical protein